MTLNTGAFAMRAEVTGTITADNTLTVPLTQTPCVYFRAEVIRMTEDENANKNEETVYEKQQATDFYLQDDTGRILVETKDLQDKLVTLQAILKYEFQ